VSEVHWDTPSEALAEEPELCVARVRLRVPSREATALPETPDSDEEGPPRRRKRTRVDQSSGEAMVAATVVHQSTTDLSLVGLQLWRGCFLLADFLLDQSQRGLLSRDAPVLEFGCGVGFLGVVMATLGVPGLVTDKPGSILSLAERNLETNRHLSDSRVKVLPLDWMDPSPDASLAAEHISGWEAQDMDYLRRSKVAVCADCVYDEALTDALFDVIRAYLHPPAAHHQDRVVFLALEKRYNFELAHLSVVAHGYRAFLCHITTEREMSPSSGSGASSPPLIRGELLHLDFPQRVLDYTRETHLLELWKLTPMRSPTRVAQKLK